MAGHGLIQDLGIAFGVAALTSVLARKLKQSSVLGYLAAGLIIGPYIPIPLFANVERMEALAEFGVIFVMFAIGLELRIGRLLRLLPVSGFTAVIQIAALLWGGFNLGRLFGWSAIEAIFLGACVCISSTMVVTKAYDQHPQEEATREYVFGVLVFQDIAAIMLISALTVIASGKGLSAAVLAAEVLKLLAALAAILAVGLTIIPRFVRSVIRLDSPEHIVIVSAGACFGLAMVAAALGYSVALGAFIAGVLVAESGEAKEIEHHIAPVKDMFAAVFFVAVGMSIDPRGLIPSAGAAAVVTGLVIVGQLFSVTLAGLLSGSGLRRALTASLSLGQIGEFGFILAAVGIGAGVVRPELRAIVVMVAIATAFTTPLLTGRAGAIVGAVDRLLPRRLQVLLVLYESWFERLRLGEHGRPPRPLKRALIAIVLDGLALIAIAFAALILAPELQGLAMTRLGLSERMAPLAVALAAVLLGAPLLWFLLRSARALGSLVAERVFPGGDAAASNQAPRRALRLASQVLVLLGVGAPAVTILRPLLDAPYVSALLLPLLLIAAAVIWRQAGAIEAEAKSMTAELIARLSREDQAEEAMPDLGATRILALTPRSPALERTLSELGLRARTGASVVAIQRPGGDVLFPTGSESLADGDRLVLAGSEEALARAWAALLGEAPSLTQVGPSRLMALGASSPVLGRSLAELDLRATTGATVLSIQRARGSVVAPTGSERLARGDRLLLAGSEESLARAQGLLSAQPPS